MDKKEAQGILNRHIMRFKQLGFLPIPKTVERIPKVKRIRCSTITGRMVSIE